MFIMLIVSLFLILFCIGAFEKSVILVGASLLFLSNLMSGIPGVKLLYLVVLVQLAVYYVKGFNRRYKDNYPRILWIPCAFAAIGYLISSITGESKGIPTTIVNIIVCFVYPFLFFKVVNSGKRLKMYIRWLLIFMAIVAVYAVIEAITNHNYYVEFAKESGIIDGIISGDERILRFGLPRCNSFFPFSSGLGMCSAMLFFLLVFMRIYNIRVSAPLEIFMFLMSVICVALCGTRSQMVVFAVLVLGLFLNMDFLKSTQSKKLIILGVIVLIAATPYFLDIVDSVINSDVRNEGSSEHMRELQYAIGFDYLLQSPLFGHGRGFLWEVAIYNNPDLFGAESVWLQLMIEYGLVGCVTYAAICICCGIWIGSFKRFLIIIPIAFVVGKTISIVAGIEINYLLLLCIIYKKMEFYYLSGNSLIPKK